MPLYEVSVRTAAPATGAPYLDIRAAASRRVALRELGVSVVSATLSSLGLVRAATVGTASTTTIPALQDTADPAPVALVGTAWSVLPTVSTNVFARRITLPATIGSGFIWVWQNGLVIPVSSSLLLWNFGAVAGSALDIYMVLEE